MHLKHTDISQCTPNGKSDRQPSSMEATMLTNVQSLEITHQVDFGAFSLDWCAGLGFTNKVLKGFFIMLMMLSMYCSMMSYPSMLHISAGCPLTKPSSSPFLTTLSFLMKIKNNYLGSHLRSLGWLLTYVTCLFR